MKNDESFIKLPLSLLQDKRLTLTQANIIAYRLGFDEYFASPKFVADLFRVTTKTVYMAFSIGKKYGYIKEDTSIPTNTECHPTVTSCNPTVTSCNPTVTSCNPTVTKVSPYGDKKEGDSPMKTDLLLDSDKIIDKKEYKITDNITKLETQPTASVRSNEKPQSDWFDKQFDDMKKESETIKYDSEVIIKFAVTNLNKECVSVYNSTKQNKNFVYYKQKNSNCWIGLTNTDYNEALELYKQGHQ